MPYAKNAIDGRRIYFEDDGGNALPVILHGGFLDSVSTVRDLDLAKALCDEFRLIYVDHRGLGRSDKPHDPEAYAMPLRVADAVAVLDELGIERAHFIGLSWGGRLGFGIGEHAPERVYSLVISGQQPYKWPDTPLSRVITAATDAAQTQGMEVLVQAMEGFWGLRFPEGLREHYLDNDPVALQAALTKVLAEGPISENLQSWRIPCLIFVGERDTDFASLARRAAEEIPDAEFLSLTDTDHIGAHLGQSDPVVDAVRRTIRRGDSESAQRQHRI
jgi:pimeloyl-ACP methyl ester carboxylesterase